jgi:hypothetical protein
MQRLSVHLPNLTGERVTRLGHQRIRTTQVIVLGSLGSPHEVPGRLLEPLNPPIFVTMFAHGTPS